MSRWLILLLLILSIPVTVIAQNWKTVPLTDTTYFTAGTLPDGKRLRVIWIDSTTVTGADSTYHFFRSIRDTMVGACIDTSGPSWLGYRCLRKPNGDEYYFNSYLDTIYIPTQAPIGHTWTIASGETGKQYLASITQVNTELVDGILDSTRTATIQAYINGNPAGDWYNGMELQWSKNHGWLKTLDFYRFPNSLQPPVHVLGAHLDSFAHLRLPKSFNNRCLDEIDLAWKYAPGNAWITESSHSAGPSFGSMSLINWSKRYDSVISVTMNPPNSATVMMWSRNISSGPPASDQFSVHQLVVQSTCTSRISEVAFPEWSGHNNFDDWQVYNKNWFIDTFCTSGGIFVRQIAVPYPHIGGAPTCRHGGLWGFSGDESYSYGLGFGQFASSSSIHQACSSSYTTTAYHSYFKLPGCKLGIYSMPPLSIDDFDLSPEVSLYPNPASGSVTLIGAPPGIPVTVKIYSTYGQLVLEAGAISDGQQLNLSGLSPGVYVAALVFKDQRQVQKLVIH